METVFDALKAMGKATSIELAARLDISREEVLNELLSGGNFNGDCF
ncbi:hypothetical protein [Escherichia coli]